MNNGVIRTKQSPSRESGSVTHQTNQSLEHTPISKEKVTESDFVKASSDMKVVDEGGFGANEVHLNTDEKLNSSALDGEEANMVEHDAEDDAIEIEDEEFDREDDDTFMEMQDTSISPERKCRSDMKLGSMEEQHSKEEDGDDLSAFKDKEHSS